MRNSAFIFENWKMKNGFSIFYFPIKIGKWKLKFFYHFSIFNFESKLKYIKISFFILILKWKLNGTFSARIEKKDFWNLFWFKISFKKQKSKYSNSFFDFKSKNEFQKLFHFSILVMKLKHEKWKIFKIRFVFKSKNELYFRYADSVHVLQPWIFELKPKLKVNFKFKFKLKFKFKFKFKLKLKFKFNSISRSNCNSDSQSSSKSNQIYNSILNSSLNFKFNFKFNFIFNFKLIFRFAVVISNETNGPPYTSYKCTHDLLRYFISIYWTFKNLIMALTEYLACSIHCFCF